MKRVAFFLLFIVLVPVNPYGAESKAGGVIDFGRIDVPFKANFTITFTLSAEKMYLRTDSPRLILPSQVTGNVGDVVSVNVTLVVPADARPRDYILHIFITPGQVGSVEAQVSYQIRFTVKGIDVAAFSAKPDSIFLAIYNSYPDSAYIRARVYMDGSLIRDLQGEAPAKGYAIRNFTGDFEGRHNFTIVAISNTGYSVERQYIGEVLPVEVKSNVKLSTNDHGIEVDVTLENRGRPVTVIVEAFGRSDNGNDSRSQSVTLDKGDKVTLQIILKLSLPAFVLVRVIAVATYQRTFRVSGQTQRTVYNFANTLIYGLILLAIGASIAKIARRPRGKFKAERVIAFGVSGPILAIRDKEPIYPPGQALTLLTLPNIDFSGDGVIIADRVYAIRSTHNLKAIVVGLGDPIKGLNKAREVRRKLSELGADILTEISPDNPIIDEIIEIVFS